LFTAGAQAALSDNTACTLSTMQDFGSLVSMVGILVTFVAYLGGHGHKFSDLDRAWCCATAGLPPGLASGCG
jgi:hypothetical protein